MLTDVKYPSISQAIIISKFLKMGACSDREELNASRPSLKNKDSQPVQQPSGHPLEIPIKSQPQVPENKKQSVQTKVRVESSLKASGARVRPTTVDQATNTDDTPNQFPEVVRSCINCAFTLRNERISDQKAMQMIRESSIAHPRLECSSGLPIVNLCISPKCQNYSLYCSTQECEDCESKHSACPSLPFKALSKLITKRKEEHMEFLTQAEQVQNQIIDAVVAERQQVHQRFDLGHMQTKYLAIIEKIYVGGEKNNLNGQMTFDLVKELKSSREDAVFHQERAIIEYADTLKDVFKDFGHAKEELDKAYLSGKLKHVFPYSYSKIDKLDRKASEFLVKCLGYPEKIDLVFRASQNGFDANKFHDKCGKKANLLVVIETEFGKVIGGFSAVAFSSKKAKYKSDPQKKSFIFSIDLKKKFTLVDENKAIYACTSHGPHFGGGDLFICDSCDTEETSECSFPCYYHDEEGQYVSSQETRTAMTGNPDGKRFKVREYEVYQVNYP